MNQETVIEVPVSPGIKGRWAIVEGKLQYITSPSPNISYRFENEEYLIFFEGTDPKKIMREIYYSEFRKLVFKIYKIKNSVKSEKYYYLINNEIRSVGNEDYYLLKIPIINKICFFKAEEYELLNVVLNDYKNNDRILIFFKNGEITNTKVLKGEPGNGI